MGYVNDTMHGYWVGIAHDENGSLVLQCILENCSQDQKVPLLNEIMGDIYSIAKGYFK